MSVLECPACRDVRLSEASGLRGVRLTEVSGLQGCLAYRGVWPTGVSGLQGCLAYRGVCLTGVSGSQRCLTYRDLIFLPFSVDFTVAWKPVAILLGGIPESKNIFTQVELQRDTKEPGETLEPQYRRQG